MTHWHDHILSLITSCICKNVTSTVPQVLKLDLLAWLSNPAICHGKWKWGPHSETSLLFWARQSSQAFLMLASSLVYDSMTLSVLCTLLVTQALKSWWGCWLQLSQVALVPASPALYYSHGLMTIVDRAVNVYTVILLERQSKHTIQHVLPCYQLCQHLLHAERPTKETSIWMEVGNQTSIEQHSHGPVRCFDPHLLWENLKVTKPSFVVSWKRSMSNVQDALCCVRIIGTKC